MPTTVTYPGVGVAMDANLATALAAAAADDKIVNGAMTADTNWTKGSGWDINLTTAGKAHAAAGSASNLTAIVPPLTSGVKYLVTFAISGYGGGNILALCGTNVGTPRAADGTFTQLIEANGTAFALSKSAAFVGDIDNVSAIDLNVIIPANANDWSIDGPAGDAQLAVNGTFAVDANWTKNTWTISGGAAHAAGISTDLVAAVAPLTSGKRYRVSYQISNYTAGTLTPVCGTALGTARSANGTYTELIISNGTAFAMRAAGLTADLDNVSIMEDTPRFALTMQAYLQLQINGNIVVNAGKLLGYRDCVIGAIKVDGWRIFGTGSVRAGGVTQFGTYGAPVAPYNAAVEGPSSPSEYRHICSVMACNDWVIDGSLSFNGSGGDGLYIGSSEHNQDILHLQCSRYEVNGLTCDGNLRQGCSVLTGIDSRFMRCTFSNTVGVSPQSGIDIEPEYDNINNIPDVISNLSLYECQAFGNASTDFLVNVSRMKSTSPPVILSYIRCKASQKSRQPWGWNMLNTVVGSGGPPSGRITLAGCIAEGLDYQAITFGNTSVPNGEWRLDQGPVVYVREFWAKDCGRLLAERPIQLNLGTTAGVGERIVFDRVRVTDRYARPVLVKLAAPTTCKEVRGTILLDPNRAQKQTATFPYLRYENYTRQKFLRATMPLTYRP